VSVQPFYGPLRGLFEEPLGLPYRFVRSHSGALRPEFEGFEWFDHIVQLRPLIPVVLPFI